MRHVILSVLILIPSVTVWGQSAVKKPTSSASKAQKIAALMQQYHRNDQFDGAWLVAESDKNIYTGAVGWAGRTWSIPNRVDTKFGLASNVKQFVAALILQLVEQGKVRLDGKITDYLPEYPKETGDRITVHQLLTHTSGIPNYTLFKDQWPLHFYNSYSPAEYVKRFSEKKLDFEPGTQFSYNNSGYYVLGMMIERLTGKSFEDALNEYVLKPVSMTHSGCMRDEVIPNLATSYQKIMSYRPFRLDYTGDVATGDMYSTVEDVYKWQKALFPDQLLSQTSRQKMMSGYVADTTRQYYKPSFYAYGLMTSKLPMGLPGDSLSIVYHTGGLGYTSLILRVPSEKHSIILLCNIFNFAYERRQNWAEMYQTIINILYDKPYTLPKPTLAVSLRNEISDKGLSAVLKRFSELKKAAKPLKDDWDLNDLGYYYLNLKRLPEAIEIMKLNTQEFPDSANVYDSLADAYNRSGNKALAIQYYEKALTIDPKFPSSLEGIKRLKGL